VTIPKGSPACGQKRQGDSAPATTNNLISADMRGSHRHAAERFRSIRVIRWPKSSLVTVVSIAGADKALSSSTKPIAGGYPRQWDRDRKALRPLGFAGHG
jgi:hypothetical protein